VIIFGKWKFREFLIWFWEFLVIFVAENLKQQNFAYDKFAQIMR